jgi:hypothetical protein
MLSVICAECGNLGLYAECHYAKCHNADCHYAECHNAECNYAEWHYAECRGATRIS